MELQRQWNLIKLRKENNLTQKELADLLRINESTYINKENGKSSFKDYEAFTLMNFFGKKFEEIFLPSNCINNATLEEEGEKHDITN